MGKSSKKSATKVDAAVVAVRQSGKKGNREAEKQLEKAVSKKQKVERDETVVAKQKVEKKPKKAASSSSDDDSDVSDDSDTKPKVVSKKTPTPIPAKNGFVTKKSKVETRSDSSDSDDSSDGELAAKKQTAAVKNGAVTVKKTPTAGSSDSSDDSSDESDDDVKPTVAPATLKKVAKKDSSSEDSESCDDDSEEEAEKKVVEQPKKTQKKPAESSDSSDSDESSSEEDTVTKAAPVAAPKGKVDSSSEEEDDSSDSDDEPKANKPKAKEAKADSSTEESSDDESSDDEASKAQPVKNVQASKKDDSSSSEDDDSDEEEVDLKTPKKKDTDVEMVDAEKSAPRAFKKTVDAAVVAVPQSGKKGFKEHSMYKNHLQEFIQRAHLPLPSYCTVNEQDIRPKFRCTVEVDGKSFTSLTTFSTRKAAEQDVAKLALEAISKDAKYRVSRKTTDGGFPPIHEDRVFSKSILHEFATKKNLDKPTYDTSKLESLVPLFVSSVVLDGVKYSGEPCVNKKEAEQLAARSAILSLLANSGSEPLLCDIVKSKVKLISAVHEHCNVNTSGSHLPNPESNADSSAIKEIVRDNVQRTGDIIGSVKSKEQQQQSASKKARILNIAAEIGQLNSETLPQTGSIHRCVTLPQPSLLPSTNSCPQPSLLQSTKTFPQPSLLASALSLPSLPTSSQEHSHENLLPCSQTLPQPNCFPYFDPAS